MSISDRAQKKEGSTPKKENASPNNSFEVAGPQTPLADIIQRSQRNPASLSSREMLQLQHALGNQAVTRLLKPHIESPVHSVPGGIDTIQRDTVTVDDTTYLILNPIPGTNMQLVRQDWKPWSDRRIHDTSDNHLLGMTLTTDQARALTQVFQELSQQGVRQLDKLMNSVQKAKDLTIPIDVTISRLRLIKQNVQDVVKARLRQDHAQLRGTLLNNAVDADFDTAFASLEIPGSDPHKGGQVVVFVNYHLLAGGTKKIVYKPGDLGIDKLLFGSDPNSVASKLGPHMENYQILEKTGGVDEPEQLQHYGYMEFVETGTPQTRANIEGVYRSLGQNLAVAYVFGLRDIHHENYLLKQDRILLIDMEAATGTFTGFATMELGKLPNDLAERIAKGLVAKTQVQVQALLPSSTELKQEVKNGFQANLTSLSNGVGIGASVTAFKDKRARFVPFKTEDLQRLAGMVLGKLGPQAKSKDLRVYNTEVEKLVDSMVLQSQMDGHQAQIRALLQANSVKAAFNRGDVPFWLREGNDIYGEDGQLIVQGFPHPRLDTKANIETRANDRRNVGNVAQGVTLLEQQALPLLGTPREKILEQHKFFRKADLNRDD